LIGRILHQPARAHHSSPDGSGIETPAWRPESWRRARRRRRSDGHAAHLPSSLRHGGL